MYSELVIPYKLRTTHFIAVALMNNIHHQFGNLDIYVFDQILKGNIAKEHRILDAGCGTGRNHFYLVNEGYDVSAFDYNETALQQAITTARTRGYPTNSFLVGDMTAIPFPDKGFDWIICVAVLHFAENDEHFSKMLDELWRVCSKGGKILIRLASDIGIDHLVKALDNNRYALPDGTERYLVSEVMILSETERLGAQLFEPIKTTNVQNLRCMTTWCLQK